MSKEIAKKWYKQALHDLEMAEKNIIIEGYDIAAFLAHQSVEKLIKSTFALQGKKIPKTHYIDEMANELKLREDIIDEVMDLTVDYTFSRYPDISQSIPCEEYDEEIAVDKVARAKKIINEIIKSYTNFEDIE